MLQNQQVGAGRQQKLQGQAAKAVQARLVGDIAQAGGLEHRIRQSASALGKSVGIIEGRPHLGGGQLVGTDGGNTTAHFGDQ